MAQVYLDEYDVEYDVLNPDGTIRNHVKTIFTMDGMEWTKGYYCAMWDKHGIYPSGIIENWP